MKSGDPFIRRIVGLFTCRNQGAANNQVVWDAFALEITPILAKRGTEHGSGLGVHRWFVERTIAWLHALGRLRRRLDRLTEIQEAFLRLGCAIVCWRFLNS